MGVDLVGPNRTRTAKEIAKIVPHCPCCGSDRYHSLTENARQEFRLKTLRCEVCQYDILAEARQLELGRCDPISAPIWFACLTFLIVLEALLLTGVLWE